MSNNQILNQSPEEVEVSNPENETDVPPTVGSSTTSRKFYPGDIVIKRTFIKHFEWVPTFGTVVKPDVNSGGTGGPVLPSDVLVHWEHVNRIENVAGSQISLVDRLLLRNMKVKNDQGLIGTVSNVKVVSTVQIIGTNHVVERVTLDRLRPISSYVRGQEILYKDWIGVIITIKRNTWFLLDGGMGFCMESTEKDGFMRSDPYWGIGVTCPGIRTKLSASAMKSAKWISGPMRFFSKWIPPLKYLYSMAYCTINKTEVTAIEVSWLQVAPGVQNPETIHKPETKLSREKLIDVTVIGTPSSETVGINSVRMMKLRPEDSLTTSSYWLDAFKQRYIDEDQTVQTRRSSQSSIAPLKALAAERVFEVPVKVLHRQSIVDVAWNDGSVERAHSIKLPFIVPTKDDSEYPQGMVVARLYNESSLVESYGVVMESDEFAKRQMRKVFVKWIVNGAVDGTQEESILNLRPHPTYSMYQRGTILFPRSPGSVPFKSAVVSDLNIPSGKMAVVVTVDNSQYEVFPHVVTPLPKRCFWNFFTRKWILDEIVPPPYQLICEFHPEKMYAHISEPTPAVLTTNNNNPEEPLILNSLWNEPGFESLGFAPETHRYYKSNYGDHFDGSYVKAIKNELKALGEPNIVPEGIWVRSYENRLDLISVLMLGPTGTPFEDGIFMFDLQLTSQFPLKPPMIHHVSYTYEISPMLSWDGNFCVGALDWNFLVEPASYVVNCVSQMQCLLFTAEPFFSDNRYPADRNTDRGHNFTRLYNEQTFLRVLDSSWNMIHNPYEPWTTLIKSHFAAILPDKLAMIEKWNLFEDSKPTDEENSQSQPEFPLIPISEGLKIALSKRLENFRRILPTSCTPAASGRNSKAESVTDATADSESVPIELEFHTNPKIDPIERDNVDDNIVISLCEPAGKLFEPNYNNAVKEILSTNESVPIDSEKNLIKRKSRGRSSRSRGSHRKNNSSKGSVSSTLSESEPEPVGEVDTVEDIIEEPPNELTTQQS